MPTTAGELASSEADITKANLKVDALPNNRADSAGQAPEHIHEQIAPGLFRKSDAASTPGQSTTTVDQAPVDSAADKHLPPLQLTDDQNTPGETSQGGFMAALGDVAHGSWNEITQHPWEVAKDAAIGVAIGAAAVVAGPEIALAAGVGMAALAIEANGGIAKTADDLYSGASNLVNDASIAASPQGHSAAEQAKAKTDLENLGAKGTDMAAGVLGGVAGGLATSAITSALAGSGEAAVATTGGEAGVATTAGQGVESAGLTGSTAGSSEANAIGATTGKIVATSGDGANTSVLSDGQVTLSDLPSGSINHAEVTAGQLTSPDGSVHDVYFHASESTPAATAARLTNEQAGNSLNRIIGFENPYPESQPVTLDIAGQTRQGWLQEAAGDPLENELKARAVSQFGTTTNMDQDVAKILAADPALNAQVQQAVVERLVYGDQDIAARNIGISGDTGAQTVRNFDLGEAFGTNTTPELRSYQTNLTTIGLQNAMSDQPLTPEVSQTLNKFLTQYDNPAGIEDLRQTGLSNEQIGGVLGRTRWLTENGRLPSVDPAVNDPQNISWWRTVEAQT